MDMENYAARLQMVEDRLGIQELISEYSHAVDDRDFDSLSELFSADAVFTHPLGTSVGRDEVISYYRFRLGQFGPTFHYPHTQAVKWVSDVEATGIVSAHAEVSQDGQTVLTAIRYYDQYVKESGRWRFRERKVKSFYAAPLEEVPTILGEHMRVRWPGIDARPAELPDEQATWTAFTET